MQVKFTSGQCHSQCHFCYYFDNFASSDIEILVIFFKKVTL